MFKFFSLFIVVYIVSGCDEGDPSKLIPAAKYCESRGGIVYIEAGAHPGTIHCANGDHTHKGYRKAGS